MSEVDLEQALEAASRGDDGGVRVIFRAIQPQLLRFLGQRAPKQEQDLASETWLQASERLAGFSGTFAEFRALVFTIARRRVIDHYRREARRPRAASIDEGGDLPASGFRPEEVLESLSATEAIEALVGSLPEAQAEVILLRIVADMSVEEVAQVVGRSAGAVRVLQHRALRRLERTYQREGV